jgi:hypothetical protein
VDCAFLQHLVGSILAHGAGVALLFAFEYVIQARPLLPSAAPACTPSTTVFSLVAFREGSMHEI